MDLTKIALQRKSEINNGDDVLVNLYNPKIKPMAIFYYGCQECDDLKEIGNFTIPKLRIFLLSLYNQRMKYNIKYSQSDFVYFSSSDAMTQKNYIPAFLTQDLCILDYKYNHYLHYNQSYRTQNGEIIYSPTLSYMDLYSYNILSNSSDEVPFDSSGKQEVCKMTFNLESTERSIRFFCVCPTHLCTLKVTQKDPLHCCPYLMNVTIKGEIEYTSLNETTDYMPVDEFFLQNKTTYCDFRLQIFASTYLPFIERVYYFLPDGYMFDTSYSFNATWYCPFLRYTKENIEPIYTTFYKNDTNQLRNVFVSVFFRFLTF
uniref:Uncharacterized protein n=1 Tax=Panagrolaimus davidi TaxID=227884 RepID=A0A914PSP7_9BILA